MSVVRESSSTASRGRWLKRSEGRRGGSASALPMDLIAYSIPSFDRAVARYPLRLPRLLRNLSRHLPRDAVEESPFEGATS